QHPTRVVQHRHVLAQQAIHRARHEERDPLHQLRTRPRARAQPHHHRRRRPPLLRAPEERRLLERQMDLGVLDPVHLLDRPLQLALQRAPVIDPLREVRHPPGGLVEQLEARPARLGDPVARQRNPHPCQVRVPNPHHRAGTVQPVLDPVLLQLRRDLADHRERHPRQQRNPRRRRRPAGDGEDHHHHRDPHADDQHPPFAASRSSSRLTFSGISAVRASTPQVCMLITDRYASASLFRTSISSSSASPASSADAMTWCSSTGSPWRNALIASFASSWSAETSPIARFSVSAKPVPPRAGPNPSSRIPPVSNGGRPAPPIPPIPPFITQTRMSIRPPRTAGADEASPAPGRYVSGPMACTRAKYARSSVVSTLHSAGSVPGGAAAGTALALGD